MRSVSSHWVRCVGAGAAGSAAGAVSVLLLWGSRGVDGTDHGAVSAAAATGIDDVLGSSAKRAATRAHGSAVPASPVVVVLVLVLVLPVAAAPSAGL